MPPSDREVDAAAYSIADSLGKAREYADPKGLYDRTYWQMIARRALASAELARPNEGVSDG